MSVEVIAQVATLVVAVLAIIWHQQHSNDKLRDDLTLANDKLRDDLTLANDKLREEVAGNGQRLARIEGFLKIGIPAEANPPESLPSEPSTPTSTAPEPTVKPITSA